MELAAMTGEFRLLHDSARFNFHIIDRMPPRARKLIDDLGPLAPRWVNDWFEQGHDPGHREP